MSILWYIGACSVFFGGSFLIHQRNELQALKKQLERTNEPDRIERNFRCHTV